MVCQYVQYKRPWACYMNLIIWSNVCVLYGPWIQWLFMASAALKGGHYRTDIINGVDHSRSNSIMPLVLCTVLCNGRGTSIVLQVPRDSTNPTENWFYLEKTIYDSYNL